MFYFAWLTQLADSHDYTAGLVALTAIVHDDEAVQKSWEEWIDELLAEMTGAHEADDIGSAATRLFFENPNASSPRKFGVLREVIHLLSVQRLLYILKK